MAVEDRARHLEPLRILQEAIRKLLDSGGMVAEKNKVWRVKGMSFAIRSMSE